MNEISCFAPAREVNSTASKVKDRIGGRSLAEIACG